VAYAQAYMIAPFKGFLFNYGAFPSQVRAN
jgi:hypothetical protein